MPCGSWSLRLEEEAWRPVFFPPALSLQGLALQSTVHV